MVEKESSPSKLDDAGSSTLCPYGLSPCLLFLLRLVQAEEGRLLKSEFQALQRRHASALELMGERDEQVDELKADLLDVKGVLRDQTDLMCQQLEAAYKEIAALKEQHTNGS